MSVPSPKLTHAFDLNVSGPPGFEVTPTKHSALCCAHGQFLIFTPPLPPLDTLSAEWSLSSGPVNKGTLTSADGSINLILANGSDWMTVHEHYATIDARISLVSPAGDARNLNLDVAYKGKIALTADVLAIFKQEKHELDFGEVYYYTTPVLESRSPELAWVNEAVFVCMGRLWLGDEGQVWVTYRIFKIG